MSRSHLNLAAKPFVNTRPVIRLSVLLWLLGLVFLAANVWVYRVFITGSGDVHTGIAEVDRSIVAERQRIEALDRKLAGFDLAQQNDQASFLNDRIESRRFSWSRLFDALTAILPQDVRLQSLRPVSVGDSKRTSRRSASAEEPVKSDRVVLNIDAQARTDQAILAFVDALFADPSFESPNLQRQAKLDNGLIGFSLDVVYHSPAAGQGAEPAPAAPQAAPPATPPADAGGTSPAVPPARSAGLSETPEGVR